MQTAGVIRQDIMRTGSLLTEEDAMNTRKWTFGLSLVVVMGSCFVSLDNEAEGGQSATDYSGTYHVAIGPEPLYTMEIDHSDTSVTFTLTGSDVSLEGSGTVSGGTMLLAADLDEMGEFEAVVEFAQDGESFSGTWEIDGEGPTQGTITGSRTPWPEYDVDALGIPLLVEADCIPLDLIQRVSKFRSGEGHDYSDDFELCRSMKHYYTPKDGVAGPSISLFSPVAGTVIGTTEEWEGPESWTGTAVGIRPEANEAFYVVLYHVDLSQPLHVGDLVTAGQELGTAMETSEAVTDVAVGLHTPYGHRLVSFFDVISIPIYARYVARGVRSRSDFIITEVERDAEPLTCVDEEFLDVGNLENWVTLDGNPPGPRRPGRRVSPLP
jgi:hypothetical protein